MIRLGVAGLGMALGKMLPAIVRHSGISIAGAASTVLEERVQFQKDFGVPVYETTEQLCENADLDAVYISTPTQLHVEHVAYALGRGKHVLVEKPLALDLEQALQLVDTAKRSGKVLIVGHSHSFDPPIRAIRQVVESGRLGAIRMVHNWCYNDWIYRPRTRDELDTELGGGVVFRQGAHQFDILRVIAGGLVESVRAVTGVWDDHRPTEGAHTALLTFANGAVATAVYNGYDHFHSSELTFGLGEWGEQDDYTDVEKYGQARKRSRSIDSKTEIELKRSRSGYRSGQLRTDSVFQRPPSFGLTLVSCEHGDIRQTPNGLAVYTDDRIEEIVMATDESAHDRVIAELYDAVTDRRQPIHDGQWACATLEVCIGVLQSSEENREIQMAHQVPVPKQV